MYSRTQITSLCVVKLLRLSTIHELSIGLHEPFDLFTGTQPNTIA